MVLAQQPANDQDYGWLTAGVKDIDRNRDDPQSAGGACKCSCSSQWAGGAQQMARQK